MRFRGILVWMLRTGRARHAGPAGKPPEKGDLATHVGIEVLNATGWSTHGDAASESDCDFCCLLRPG